MKGGLYALVYNPLFGGFQFRIKQALSRVQGFVFFIFFVGGVLWGLGVRVWGWGLGIFRAQRNSLEHVNFSLKS